MLQHALRYLRSGFSVIPLKPRSKEPLIPWKEYQTRLPTVAEVATWWSATPTANVGIVTGKVSKLAVIDLDGPNGIKSGQLLKLASTVIVKTGKGLQYYYSDPGGLCRNEVKKHYDGVDLRGEGGFVVAPPSLHPQTLTRYSWLKNVVGVEKLPPFPVHLFAPDAMTQENSTQTTPAKPRLDIAKALEEMKDGNIDETLFRVCSRLRNDGFSELDCLGLLGPHAERVGASPGHLEEKIQNVWNRYTPRECAIGRISSSAGPDLQRTGIVIHSPTNPDSREQYRLHLLESDAVSEYPTGYTGFDTLTGGLRKGEILTVGARTGVGKTNWLIGPARTLCSAGKKILLFSTEMSFDQIWSRYRATLKNDGDFANHKFYVCDDFAPNTERVEEALRLIMPDVFMFDHINNVGEEHLALADFMKGLKFLARKFQIPCIMTAQLNRGADWVENGERVAPRLSMIKGSGTIEEVSAQVLLLAEKRVTPEGTEIFGVVDKNRFGQKGMLNFVLRQKPWRVEEITK